MATWALDLDGVLWRGAMPIPGSADAVAPGSTIVAAAWAEVSTSSAVVATPCRSSLAT